MTRKNDEAQHLKTRPVRRTYLLWMQTARRAAQVPHRTAEKHDGLHGHRDITEPPRITLISRF